MKRPTKADRQADWLAQFTDALLTRVPRLAGRIDWDAAKYYYLYGTDVSDAVNQYIIARNIETLTPPPPNKSASPTWPATPKPPIYWRASTPYNGP